jgi:hypothetical protein
MTTLTFYPDGHIDKDYYLGNPIKVSYPLVDSLVELIRVKGQGCHCFKRDLKRAYRQIPCCPGDWHLSGSLSFLGTELSGLITISVLNGFLKNGPIIAPYVHSFFKYFSILSGKFVAPV